MGINPTPATGINPASAVGGYSPTINGYSPAINGYAGAVPQLPMQPQSSFPWNAGVSMQAAPVHHVHYDNYY